MKNPLVHLQFYKGKKQKQKTKKLLNSCRLVGC